MSNEQICAGAIFKLKDGLIATVQLREIMPANRINVHGVRRGPDYIQYKLDQHPGITFYMAVGGFKKRIAEVLSA